MSDTVRSALLGLLIGVVIVAIAWAARSALSGGPCEAAVASICRHVPDDCERYSALIERARPSADRCAVAVDKLAGAGDLPETLRPQAARQVALELAGLRYLLRVWAKTREWMGELEIADRISFDTRQKIARFGGLACAPVLDRWRAEIAGDQNHARLRSLHETLKDLNDRKDLGDVDAWQAWCSARVEEAIVKSVEYSDREAKGAPSP